MNELGDLKNRLEITSRILLRCFILNFALILFWFFFDWQRSVGIWDPFKDFRYHQAWICIDQLLRNGLYKTVQYYLLSFSLCCNQAGAEVQFYTIRKLSWSFPQSAGKERWTPSWKKGLNIYFYGWLIH